MVTVKQRKVKDDINSRENIVQLIRDYPDNEFKEVIQDIGFNCEMCTKCCTASFNDHILLLENDIERIKDIDPTVLYPAPDFEFCDQYGKLYSCGYTIKTKNDSDKTCIFLQNGLCTIYSKRPLICRVYPYMLFPVIKKKGNVDWNMISGLNEHGYYHNHIDDETCNSIIHQTKEYEIRFQEHMIMFMRTILTHFQKNGLKHIPAMQAQKIREYNKGQTIEILVYHKGKFETFSEQK